MRYLYAVAMHAMIWESCARALSVRSAIGCPRTRISFLCTHIRAMHTHAEDLFAQQLNPSQRAAVFAPLQHMRVVAGPGSGKTRVLVHRIAYLVERLHIPPWSILAVTFTNKAAFEMRQRLQGMIGQEKAAQVQLSTLHALGFRTLRYFWEDYIALHPRREAYPFTIIDDEVACRFIKKCLLMKGDTEEEPGKILELIKQLKRDGLTKADGLSEKLENAQAVNEEYSSWLHQNNCMDYEDLITGAIELLCCEEACLRRARSRFHHILVDEFQDTDRAQYMMIRLLGCDDSQLSNVVNACYSAYATTTKSKRASVSPAESSPPSRTVCIVGDANQAIYSWRGADAKMMDRFSVEYTDCLTVELRENYRSLPTLVDVCRSVLDAAKKNSTGVPEVASAEMPKVMLPNYELGSIPTVVAVRAADCKGQANFIAGSISILSARFGVPFEEIVILYRTHAQSTALQNALLMEKVPFTVIGRTKLTERKEVRDLLSFLRVMLNPSDTDALRRVINIPRRSIGEKTQNLFFDACKEARIPALFALLRFVDPSQEPLNLKLSARSASALMNASHWFTGLRDACQSSNSHPISTALSYILTEGGYKEYLTGMCKTEEEVECRLENVQTLMNLARLSEMSTESNGQRSVFEAITSNNATEQNQPDAAPSIPDFFSVFLEKMNLEQQENAGAEEVSLETMSLPSVKLMTLHASKGLEFDTVFVTGLEEETLPGSLLPRGVEGADYNWENNIYVEPVSGLSHKARLREENLAEARRLLYVGMTRAKRRLYLTYRDWVPRPNEPNARKAKPSRFLVALRDRIPFIRTW